MADKPLWPAPTPCVTEECRRGRRTDAVTAEVDRVRAGRTVKGAWIGDMLPEGAKTIAKQVFPSRAARRSRR